jgi:acyl-CoA thioesterase I
MLTEIRTVLKPLVLEVARVIMPNSIHRLEQLNDWAQLGFYQVKNKALLPLDLGENRIVFFGDSITEFWDLAAAFPNEPYINRGIAGQTTSQMLLRFRADAIALQPKVVLILAGINDISGNTGVITLEAIEDNYASICDLACMHGIGVVFASVLPIHDYGAVKQSEFRSPGKIEALNEWLKHYCTKNQMVYLDYYTHVVDCQGMLKVEFSTDGVHPNLKCYQVMTPLAKIAIQEASKKC